MDAQHAMYLEAFSYGLGEGSYNPFTRTLDVSDADFLDGKLHNKRGAPWEYKGNKFRIVRVRSANVVAGTPLKSFIGGATRTGTMSASTKAVSTTDETFVANDVAGGLIFTTGGTGGTTPQIRYIMENDTTTVTVAERDQAHNIAAVNTPNAWTTTPDATTTYGIYCHWEVERSTAAADLVWGVALGTVTNGNWTIVIEEGPALVNVVGTTDATTAGGLIVPSATAGAAKGPTAAGITATEAAGYFARALMAHSGAATLIPALMLRKFAP